MTRLQDEFNKFKNGLSAEVVSQINDALDSLEIEVTKYEGKLSDAIASDRNRKDTIEKLETNVKELSKDKESLTTKLTDTEKKVADYETTKTELDTFKSESEKTIRSQFDEALKILKVDQTSPIYAKVQKVAKFFQLPANEKEVLPIEVIKANLKTYEQYEAAEYFKTDSEGKPFVYDKSGKSPDPKKTEPETPENPFKDSFSDFDKNQT